MGRRRFSEREVLQTVWFQGHDLRCYRCKEPLFSATEIRPKIEREHLTEIALGGQDHPFNCRYSHAPCHKRITNGTKATTAGSSKQRIAKVKRIVAKAAGKKRKTKKIPPRPFDKAHKPMTRRYTDNTKRIENT